MGIVSGVASALQRLLGSKAEETAEASGLIKRRRKFSGSTLLSTFVLGFLRKPKATSEDLARTAAELGVGVTPQAVRKRYGPDLVESLRNLFDAGVTEAIAGEARSIPLLRKFTAVDIGDSSTIGLPDELAEQFPGCGGKSESGKAALKLQVELDQIDGRLKVVLEAGRQSDAKSALMKTLPAGGSLTIRDLGYFSLEWFNSLIAVAAFFISRLQPKTMVFDPEGTPLDLLKTLQEYTGDKPFERDVLLGKDERVPCRLIALRAPPEAVARRRQKAYEKARKDGRTPSAEHLAWLAFTVFITNCGSEKLSWKEVVVLYRLRWQIELLFKLWKSHNLLAHVDERDTADMRMAKFYARLTGALVQHWILLTSAWTSARHSLRKAAVVIQEHLLLILAAITDSEQLRLTLERLTRLVDRPSRIGKRKQRPGTHQLLLNPELLEYVF